MINKNLADTIIWTDYSAIIQIIKQIILISNFTDKLNFHLIQASQYCSQFHLDFWHQSDWLNKVSDVLSRLFNQIINKKSKNNTLDKVFIYHTMIVQMSLKFWEKIKKNYLEDKCWKETIRQLKRTEEAKTIRMSFHLDDELIYYINSSDYCCCLCILKNLKKDIFQMTHNEFHHVNFHQIYNIIVVSIFIQNLSKRLIQYIVHYS